MAITYNHIVIKGNVGHDPDLKTLGSGAQVCNLSVATDSGYFDRETNEWVQNMQWHRCTFWNKAAEAVAAKVRSGDSILVAGELRYSEYELQGKTIKAAEIFVKDYVHSGKRKGSDDSYQQRQQGKSKPNAKAKKQQPPQEDDDVPF